MKLPIPENYSIPTEIEDGGTFEELVTFRVEGDMLVPTMLAGVEIAAEDEEATEDEAVAEMEGEEAASMAGMGERIMGMA